MEISAITDPSALNSIADQSRKAANIVQQQPQPQSEKAAAEQQPAEAISYSQSGITVNISEQGMEASKKIETSQAAPVATPASAYVNAQTTDYNKVYLEAKQLVEENLPDMQIRERTQISETELDRIHKEQAQIA